MGVGVMAAVAAAAVVVGVGEGDGTVERARSTPPTTPPTTTLAAVVAEAAVHTAGVAVVPASAVDVRVRVGGGAKPRGGAKREGRRRVGGVTAVPRTPLTTPVV